MNTTRVDTDSESSCQSFKKRDLDSGPLTKTTKTIFYTVAVLFLGASFILLILGIFGVLTPTQPVVPTTTRIVVRKTSITPEPTRKSTPGKASTTPRTTNTVTSTPKTNRTTTMTTTKASTTTRAPTVPTTAVVSVTGSDGSELTDHPVITTEATVEPENGNSTSSVALETEAPKSSTSKCRIFCGTSSGTS
ncbi:hypothetical protein RvY_07292 [Ramazzottius varieornatus]|uniref:CLLAC-motif containing domain-containing protein n=1 Tax=Ramazzottius varieornatus TaxID=947166 RepID=A0A1D1V1L5_RAMVA|nr:hypothetical protein RvY_07292 [Ramazzottius varieornatus]